MKFDIELSADLLDSVKWWRKVVCAQKSENPEELTSLAEDESLKEQILENPHTPPLVKVWVRSGRYGAMTLKEFLESACPIK